MRSGYVEVVGSDMARVWALTWIWMLVFVESQSQGGDLRVCAVGRSRQKGAGSDHWITGRNDHRGATPEHIPHHTTCDSP
jgi:hypothetical protein